MPATYTDQIDGLATSVAVKAPVRVDTSVNITLSGVQTIQGIAVVAGDRVLVKAQTDAKYNGIYNASETAWVRALDFDGNRDVVQNTIVYIAQGPNAGRGFYVTTLNPIVIDTSEIVFDDLPGDSELDELLPIVGTPKDFVVFDAASSPGTSPYTTVLDQLTAGVVADADIQAVLAAKADAELAADNAATSAVAAASSAAQAALNANIYADTATGLAATADGEFFLVPAGPDPTDALTLYRHDAGPVATVIAQFATLAAVDAVFALIESRLILTSIPGWAFAVLDTNGLIAGGVRSDGIAEFCKMRLVNLAGEEVILEVLPGGTLNVGATASASVEADPYLPAQIALIVFYGQSNARGTKSTPPDTTPLTKGLMFVGGDRPDDADADQDSVFSGAAIASTVAFESAVSPHDAVLGETANRAVIKMIYQLLRDENGIDTDTLNFDVLAAAPGRGSKSISQLSNGSVYFTRMEQLPSAALDIAIVAGKTCAVGPLLMDQGEQDSALGTSRTDYKNAFKLLRTDHQSAVRTAMGDATLEIPMLAIQIASHTVNGATPTIPLAQMDAEAEDDLIHIVTTPYFASYSDSVHRDLRGTRWEGAHLGLAIKRVFIDRVDPPNLRIVSKRVQGRVVDIEYNQEIDIDTSIVSDPGNYGMQIVDTVGVDVTASVAITRPRWLRITATSTILSGWYARFGWGTNGNWAGPINGPRTNIRGKAASPIIFDPEGDALPLYDWHPIGELALI